ncbi:MAG: hypothetical protein CYPHOPRED_003014 [Cyphobasidiales sp. Tagirdzhanova-0007]|nr:MAG: hypothetical protein CYPHOPRED_003014 [Cyphobasidiales sp. Tagirdzhanova-0007]
MAAPALRVSKKAMAFAQRLNRLKNGPAAFALPNAIRELEMTFAFRNRDYGARKFLKLDMPSILYANPNLSVKTRRPDRIEDPTMVVHYNDRPAHTIHLKMKTDEAIREELRAIVINSSSKSQNEALHAPKSSSTITPPPPPEGEIEAGVDNGTARQ